jgi:peptidoglycan/LPS O-acetylase OafA/YrhL
MLVPILPVIANGHLGVSIFFAISGYLITTLLMREWFRAGTVSLRSFYLRRALRIFPAFYTYLFVMVVLTRLDVLTIPNSDFWAAGLYLWNYHFDESNWYLGHFWSLALEEQFYLFWPLCLWLVTPRRAGVFALGIILAMPTARMLTYTHWPESRSHTGMMLHTNLDGIMVGCLAALGSESNRFRSLIQRLCRVPVLVVGLAFLFVASPLLAEKYREAYMLPFGYLAESVAITVLMLGLIYQPDRSAARLLNTRPLIYMGGLSYSLYIWQQPFLTAENISWTGLFPINLGCVFGTALLSYYLVERPFLSLKDRWSRARPQLDSAKQNLAPTL